MERQEKEEEEALKGTLMVRDWERGVDKSNEEYWISLRLNLAPRVEFHQQSWGEREEGNEARRR